MFLKHVPMTILVFLCLGFSSSIAADLSDVKTITQTVKLYEGVLSFPPPPWVNEVEDLGNSKYYRDQQNNLFTLEQIPKAQEFESWTNLYGVYGFYLPEYDMKRFIEESLNALALGCKIKGRSKLVSAENGGIVMTYFCSDLQDPLVTNGKNTESGFLYMSQVDNSFAKVYMAWRAKKEDMKTEKWPMNKELVTKAVDAMKKIRYFKAE